jgi:hypothetical protein
MLRVAIVLAMLASAAAAQEAQQRIGAAPEKENMELVGWSDLQARSAYQPTIHQSNGRWIAYVGHHGGTDSEPQAMNPLTGKREFNGTSLLDVTDPKKPKYLAHIPGAEGLYEDGGAQMVRVCDGKDLPKGDKAKTYMLRTLGNLGHEIWDVTTPEKPQKLAELLGLHGTHKNWWECTTGIAYLVSGAGEWRVHRMTQIYDLSDPAKPQHIRDFGLPGQQPGATGDAPTMLHGPISIPERNRVYFGYGTNSGGILQIVDREKLLNGPKEPTPENLLAPQIARLDMPPNVGAHTVFPVLGVDLPEFARDKEGARRDFVVITDESILNECLEARQMVWVVDVTAETKPWPVASWTVPEASGHFCERGGRFGTHSSNESMAPVFYKKIMVFAHFNAGVRAVDIRDPFRPREVAHFIPAITEMTDKRCVKVEGKDRCKVAIQTNNVEIDERGYIYAVDRANTGLHILELTGEARKAAGLN